MNTAQCSTIHWLRSKISNYFANASSVKEKRPLGRSLSNGCFSHHFLRNQSQANTCFVSFSSTSDRRFTGDYQVDSNLGRSFISPWYCRSSPRGERINRVRHARHLIFYRRANFTAIFCSKLHYKKKEIGVIEQDKIQCNYSITTTPTLLNIAPLNTSSWKLFHWGSEILRHKVRPTTTYLTVLLQVFRPRLRSTVLHQTRFEYCRYQTV